MPQNFVFTDGDWYFAPGSELGLPFAPTPRVDNPPLGQSPDYIAMLPAYIAWQAAPPDIVRMRYVAQIPSVTTSRLLLVNGVNFLLLTDASSHLLL